jgi:hypothetical protein
MIRQLEERKRQATEQTRQHILEVKARLREETCPHLPLKFLETVKRASDVFGVNFFDTLNSKEEDGEGKGGGEGEEEEAAVKAKAGGDEEKEEEEEEAEAEEDAAELEQEGADLFTVSVRVRRRWDCCCWGVEG